jgi:hypothetical protein
VAVGPDAGEGVRRADEGIVPGNAAVLVKAKNLAVRQAVNKGFRNDPALV